MGKNDPGGLKAVANKIKSKGLQRLRWFCQVCEKQCRDENGFKCHTTSESHLRQMSVFGQNPNRVINDYSKEFERRFLEHVALSHRNTRVPVQLVYNEYIADKQHVHMNATRWTGLTQFAMDLAKRGVITVEDTPKGLMMVYKPQDAEEAIRDAKNAKRERAAEDETSREERLLEEQIAKAARRDEGQPGAVAPQQFVRGKEAVRMQLAAPRNAKRHVALAAGAAEERCAGGAASQRPHGEGGALAEIIASESRAKATASQAAASHAGASQAAAAAAAAAGGGHPGDSWLSEGLVVKVMARELSSAGFYKCKAVVRRVLDLYVAELEVLPSGDVIRVDQQHLETVLPPLGGALRVLQGAAKGCSAQLLSVDVERFKARVRVRSRGAFEGQEIELDYEHVSKLAE